MKYYVYVLESLKTGKSYTGLTSNLERRLREHNQGLSRFTRRKGPWRVLYSEEKNSLSEAQKREKFLKTGDGRQALKNLLKKSS